MENQPNDRYADPEALEADVEAWLADEPVSVYRDSPGTRLVRGRAEPDRCRDGHGVRDCCADRTCRRLGDPAQCQLRTGAIQRSLDRLERSRARPVRLGDGYGHEIPHRCQR